MEHARIDQRMRLAVLYPMKQITHQFWYSCRWRSHVQTVAIPIEHSDALLTIVTGITYQLTHHQSVSLLQVFLFESVQLRHQSIGLDSILHFLYLVRSTKHMFAVDDIRHLFQRKRIILDGQ